VGVAIFLSEGNSGSTPSERGELRGEHPTEEEAELATGPRSMAFPLPFHGDGPGRAGTSAKGPTDEEATEGTGVAKGNGTTPESAEREPEVAAGTTTSKSARGRREVPREQTAKVPGKTGKELEEEMGAMGNGSTSERAAKPTEKPKEEEQRATGGTTEEPKDEEQRPTGGTKEEPKGEEQRPTGGTAEEPEGEEQIPTGGTTEEPEGEEQRPTGGTAEPEGEEQRPTGGTTEEGKEEGREHTEEEDDEPTKEAPKEMGRGAKSRATGAERAMGAFRPWPKRLEGGTIFRRRLSSFEREESDEGGGEAKGTRREEVGEGGQMSMPSMAPRADGHSTTSSS